MTNVIQVHTTTERKDDAQQIAARLLERRLAACVQISGPIESHYRWEGSLQQSDEWLVTIKTTRERYGAVETTIREVHPYDEPEILAVSVVAGSPSYLDWVKAEVRSGSDNESA